MSSALRSTFRIVMKKKSLALNYFRLNSENPGEKFLSENYIRGTVSGGAALVERYNPAGEAIGEMQIMVDADYRKTPFFKRPV